MNSFSHKLDRLGDLSWIVFNDVDVVKKLKARAFQRHQNRRERGNITSIHCHVLIFVRNEGIKKFIRNDGIRQKIFNT